MINIIENLCDALYPVFIVGSDFVHVFLFFISTINTSFWTC